MMNCIDFDKLGTETTENFVRAIEGIITVIKREFSGDLLSNIISSIAIAVDHESTKEDSLHYRKTFMSILDQYTDMS